MEGSLLHMEAWEVYLHLCSSCKCPLSHAHLPAPRVQRQDDRIVEVESLGPRRINPMIPETTGKNLLSLDWLEEVIFGRLSPPQDPCNCGSSRESISKMHPDPLNLSS